MRINQKRKAMMMSVGLAIGTAVVLARLFMLFVGVESEVFNNNKLGQNELWLLEAIQDNQKAVLFEEQYWAFAARESVLDLLEHGGYYETPQCGVHEGVYLWKSNETECHPSLFTINEEGKKLLASHELRRKALKNYPDSRHEFYIGSRGGRTAVKGSAMRQIATDIKCTGGIGSPILSLYPEIFTDNAYHTTNLSDLCGRIYEKPSFSQEIGIDLLAFEQAQREIPGIISSITSCESGGKSLEECRAITITALNIKGELGWLQECAALSPELNTAPSKRHVKLCVDTESNVLAHYNGELKAHPAIIKFAVYVPQPAPAAS